MKAQKKGFTIIEVVLALAIVALIFLMIFVALPAAQRAQRDRLRKQDVGIIAAAVRQYMSNNKGRPPPDSGVDFSVERDPDDERWDMDGDGIADSWSSGNHSTELDPYLSGVSEGWVTTTVAVLDARNSSSLFFAIDDVERAGLVWVVIGALCPDDSNDFLTQMIITRKRSDVSVFRYLESGGFFCENV